VNAEQITALKQVAIAAVRILAALENDYCEHDREHTVLNRIWYCDDC
jgi:hypothetical protein